MWRPELVTTVPAESRYLNNRREFNGALYYPLPGYLGTMPAYQSRLEAMYSESKGQLQLDHPCLHYVRTMNVRNPWITGMHVWYNSTHVSPNPGKWWCDPNHVEWVWGNTITSVFGALADPSLTFGHWNNPVKDLPVLAVPIDGHEGWKLHPSMSPDDWNLLIQRGLNAMLPGIKASLSLPNALFELKDMKTLARSMKRVHQGLDALNTLRRLGNELRKGRNARAALRTILRSVSDGYLQSNFNLLPLLRDIAALRSSCVSLRRDLENLRQRANVRQRRHYKAFLNETFPDENRTLPLQYANNYVRTEGTAGRIVRYDVREFHATIEYSYKLPIHWRGDFASIAGMMDRWGVNFNPAIIWNAIPWSFVVDWVFGVSRWLDQFKTRMLEPEVHIHGFCCSVHTQRVVTTTLNVGTYAGPVSTVQEEAYERKVGLDQAEVTSSIQSSGLNLKEFSLSAALLLSRQRRIG